MQIGSLASDQESLIRIKRPEITNLKTTPSVPKNVDLANGNRSRGE